MGCASCTARRVALAALSLSLLQQQHVIQARAICTILWVLHPEIKDKKPHSWYKSTTARVSDRCCPVLSYGMLLPGTSDHGHGTVGVPPYAPATRGPYKAARSTKAEYEECSTEEDVAVLTQRGVRAGGRGRGGGRERGRGSEDYCSASGEGGRGVR
eukprot:2029433-Rhodomonas_salina.1